MGPNISCLGFGGAVPFLKIVPNKYLFWAPGIYQLGNASSRTIDEVMQRFLFGWEVPLRGLPEYYSQPKFDQCCTFKESEDRPS